MTDTNQGGWWDSTKDFLADDLGLGSGADWTSAMGNIGGIAGALGSGGPQAMSNFVNKIAQSQELELSRQWEGFQKSQDRAFTFVRDAAQRRHEKEMIQHKYDLEQGADKAQTIRSTTARLYNLNPGELAQAAKSVNLEPKDAATPAGKAKLAAALWLAHGKGPDPLLGPTKAAQARDVTLKEFARLGYDPTKLIDKATATLNSELVTAQQHEESFKSVLQTMQVKYQSITESLRDLFKEPLSKQNETAKALKAEAAALGVGFQTALESNEFYKRMNEGPYASQVSQITATAESIVGRIDDNIKHTGVDGAAVTLDRLAEAGDLAKWSGTQKDTIPDQDTWDNLMEKEATVETLKQWKNVLKIIRSSKHKLEEILGKSGNTNNIAKASNAWAAYLKKNPDNDISDALNEMRTTEQQAWSPELAELEKSIKTIAKATDGTLIRKVGQFRMKGVEQQGYQSTLLQFLPSWQVSQIAPDTTASSLLALKDEVFNNSLGDKEIAVRSMFPPENILGLEETKTYKPNEQLSFKKFEPSKLVEQPAFIKSLAESYLLPQFENQDSDRESLEDISEKYIGELDQRLGDSLGGAEKTKLLKNLRREIKQQIRSSTPNIKAVTEYADMPDLLPSDMIPKISYIGSRKNIYGSIDPQRGATIIDEVSANAPRMAFTQTQVTEALTNLETSLAAVAGPFHADFPHPSTKLGGAQQTGVVHLNSILQYAAERMPHLDAALRAGGVVDLESGHKYFQLDYHLFPNPLGYQDVGQSKMISYLRDTHEETGYPVAGGHDFAWKSTVVGEGARDPNFMTGLWPAVFGGDTSKVVGEMVRGEGRAGAVSGFVNMPINAQTVTNPNDIAGLLLLQQGVINLGEARIESQLVRSDVTNIGKAQAWGYEPVDVGVGGSPDIDIGVTISELLGGDVPPPTMEIVGGQSQANPRPDNLVPTEQRVTADIKRVDAAIEALEQGKTSRLGNIYDRDDDPQIVDQFFYDEAYHNAALQELTNTRAKLISAQKAFSQQSLSKNYVAILPFIFNGSDRQTHARTPEELGDAYFAQSALFGAISDPTKFSTKVDTQVANIKEATTYLDATKLVFTYLKDMATSMKTFSANVSMEDRKAVIAGIHHQLDAIREDVEAVAAADPLNHKKDWAQVGMHRFLGKTYDEIDQVGPKATALIAARLSAESDSDTDIYSATNGRGGSAFVVAPPPTPTAAIAATPATAQTTPHPTYTPPPGTKPPPPIGGQYIPPIESPPDPSGLTGEELKKLNKQYLEMHKAAVGEARRAATKAEEDARYAKEVAERAAKRKGDPTGPGIAIQREEAAIAARKAAKELKAAEAAEKKAKKLVAGKPKPKAAAEPFGGKSPDFSVAHIKGGVSNEAFLSIAKNSLHPRRKLTSAEKKLVIEMIEGMRKQASKDSSEFNYDTKTGKRTAKKKKK